MHCRRRGFSVVQLLVYLIVLAILAGAGFAVYSSLRPKVTTTTITRGPVVKAVYATGTISPMREFPIRSRRAGTLEQVLVDKGDRVAAGQPLGLVFDGALQYAVDKARAELAEKQARLDPATSPVLAEFDAKIKATTEQLGIAQREETRLRQTFERQASTSVDLDRAADRVQSLWSAVESLKSQRASKLLELEREAAFAQSALKTAEWDMGEQRLVAPIDGVVLDRPTSQGTRVAMNEVLMRVADVTPARLVMRAAVDEEDITSVSLGQRVIMTLYAFEQEQFEGRVKTIYAEADPSRRTFEVDVDVQKPSDRFQAGMTGELAFVVEEKADAAVLPAQSLQNGYVYVIRGGRIERTSPTIGVRAVDRIELMDGLNPDEQVIVSAVTDDLVGKRPRVERVDPRIATGIDRPNSNAQSFKGLNR